MNAETKCAWEGCDASFSGDLPYGWVWLVTYWRPTADIMTDAIPDLRRDTALCPHHNAALERLLKEIPWHVRMSAQGAA
jgi:hypothetical protein